MNDVPARIGLIGGGWRAEYYLRVAQQVPEAFQVGTVFVRSEATAHRIVEKWSVTVVTDLAAFLRRGPYDYVVLSVPSEAASAYMTELVEANVPVLTETPPAKDLDALTRQFSAIGGAPIQVAEQYAYQAHMTARLAVADSGLLGEVHTINVSAAHDYHAVALMRRALHAGFEPVTITGRTISDLVASSRGRDDWLESITEKQTSRDFAWIDFDRGIATYDFANEQYVSPIRSRRVAIAGPMGELINDTGSYLVEPGRSAEIRLSREATGLDGDLEGSFLRRIVDGASVYFETPFAQSRLNDDELAVATVMRKMSEFVTTGTEFYGLADGSHDHYLGLLIHQAIDSGQPVRSTAQPWSNTPSVVSR